MESGPHTRTRFHIPTARPSTHTAPVYTRPDIRAKKPSRRRSLPQPLLLNPVRFGPTLLLQRLPIQPFSARDNGIPDETAAGEAPHDQIRSTREHTVSRLSLGPGHVQHDSESRPVQRPVEHHPDRTLVKGVRTLRRE